MKSFLSILFSAITFFLLSLTSYANIPPDSCFTCAESIDEDEYAVSELFNGEIPLEIVLTFNFNDVLYSEDDSEFGGMLQLVREDFKKQEFNITLA